MESRGQGDKGTIRQGDKGGDKEKKRQNPGYIYTIQLNIYIYYIHYIHYTAQGD